MRTRMLVPLAILLLTMFLTMGIAAAGDLDRLIPAENMDEDAVASSTGEALIVFLLPPIFSETLTDEDLGSGVDNRQGN